MLVCGWFVLKITVSHCMKNLKHQHVNKTIVLFEVPVT